MKINRSATHSTGEEAAVMSASLSEWVERLGISSLPAIPFTLQRIPILLDRQSTTNADFERVIGRDPGFALALFRALGANATQLEEPISSLAHAVSMLGVDAVTRTRRTLKVLEPPSKKHDTGALYECYSRAAHAAVYALNLAHGHRDERPEQIAIAALLHGCGEMALWSNAKEEMLKIREQMAKGLNRDSASLAVLGFTLDQLSLGLAKRWHLPPLTIKALSPTGAFESRPLGVMLASSMAEKTAQGWYSDSAEELFELAADYQRVSPEQAINRCHRWAAEAARNLYDLTMPLSAYSLMNPVPVLAASTTEEETTTSEGAAEKVATKKPTQKRAAPKQKSHPQADRSEVKGKPTTASTSTSTSTSTAKKSAAPSGKTVPIDDKLLQEQVIHTFKEMREKLGVKRAMFARLTPGGNELKVKFVIGAEKSAPLRQFNAKLDEKHLFSLLMKKPQCFWLKPDNREKYLPLIPESLHPALEMEGFFAISVFVRHRPLGLIYADFTTPEALTAEGYELFRQLGQALGTTLGSHPSG
ncbi:MAG: HDOD domain-containing protein [Candidatus Sedimenticola sp. (ex Thyasira tokunagai)]